MSKTHLKREIAALSHNLHNIDLQIQNLRAQGNRQKKI